MIKYVFKTYIADGVEHYVYGAVTCKDFDLKLQNIGFPDSLLSLAYMDIGTIEPLVKKLNDELWELITTHDKKHIEAAHALLAELALRHVYFEHFQLDWQYRLSRAVIFEDYTETMLPRQYLSGLSKNLRRMQAQVIDLFKNVLDIDRSKEPVSQRMVAYYNANGDNAFRFCPEPVGFELINKSIFAEVLSPETVYDILDYHLRECVKRKVKMRVCKNCGKYFAVTGRATTEYCDRVFDEKGRTCKDVGAIVQWTRSKQDDDIFKAYRREYKKRFAWITAGRISDEDFYTWSEKAREQKKKCDKGLITLEEFQRWLSES